jgi:hypothetical protein
MAFLVSYKNEQILKKKRSRDAILQKAQQQSAREEEKIKKRLDNDLAKQKKAQQRAKEKIKKNDLVKQNKELGKFARNTKKELEKLKQLPPILFSRLTKETKKRDIAEMFPRRTTLMKSENLSSDDEML